MDVMINATVFYSFQVCPRQAWFYHHGISSDKDNPYLDLGRLIHEKSYQRERKEIFVDQLLKIDLFRGELVAEVKKSSRHMEAAKFQLAYYLYYLKHEKGLEFEGILLFPKERKTERVTLTDELESKIESILDAMKPILSTDRPPPAKRIKYCKSCSFYEYCWSDEDD
jgi:CRISPR-associated exonuclease Cas4